MIKEEFNKIKEYIENSYKIKCDVLKSNIHDYILKFESEKYDLEIALEKADNKHYLFGKSELVLYYNYDANKKNRTQLGCHGGGYSDGYNKKDYSNIDIFLKRWLIKKEQQITIFDLD